MEIVAMEFDIKKKENALNTIRLLAAIEVMWGHMVRHLDISFPQMGRVSLGNIISRILSLFQGIPIFFFISGFLLWFSVNKEESVKIYFSKRFRRIYPELWGGVIISVFSTALM